MIDIAGTFFRAVLPQHSGAALEGSHGPGRYNRAQQPTLYMSSSEEGVAAAMIKHTRPGDPERMLVRLRVHASSILDLRDAARCRALGIEPDEAFGDWQAALAAEKVPDSWLVRDKAEALGANGLIDPSRKNPGLWHLTLFRWNEPGAATVEAISK